jgi:hypothetical protein
LIVLREATQYLHYTKTRINTRTNTRINTRIILLRIEVKDRKSYKAINAAINAIGCAVCGAKSYKAIK